jgi:16S rRNA (cytosine1407-C5)-methyltransferase
MELMSKSNINLNISKFYLNKWKELYPNNFDEIVHYNTNGINTFIRSNSIKINYTSLKYILKEKKIILEELGSLKDTGFIKSSKIGIGNTHEYLKGFYTIQGLASQIPVRCFNFYNDSEKTDDKIRVLDMTSAPGNKCSQMASYLNNKHPIIAIEMSEKRINKINANLRRLGVSCVLVLNGNATGVVPRLGLFSHILLDAPCSGSGSICRNPERNSNWSPSKENFQKLVSQQESLLMKGVEALEIGGELIYSTCSIEPEENEEIINRVLSKHSRIKVIDLSKIKKDFQPFSKFGTINNEELADKCLRFLPSRYHEGFFVCKVTKTN